LKRKFISVLFATVLILTTCLAMAVPVLATSGVGLSGTVYDSLLMLENKTPSATAPWTVKTGDDIGGTFGYNNSGTSLIWGLEAEGIADGTYALIYYADAPGDRFGEWGGDNPGAVISNTIVVSGNAVSTSGTIDLGMDLPCAPDANQFEHDYTSEYGTDHGAKIWLIPVAALSSGVLPVQAWPPTDNWLFETDLITYNDTEVTSNIVAITVAPTSIDFGILVPGATADGGDITVTNDGNVPITVAAQVMASGNVFSGLQLDGNDAGGYSVDLPYEDDFADVAVTLPVVSTYTPAGTETGTLTFIATLDPTP